MQVTLWIPRGGSGIKLQPPQELGGVVKLVLWDDIGQPLMVVIQQTPTHLWVVKQGDDDFEEALAKLGIVSKPMEVVHAELPKAPQ